MITQKNDQMTSAIPGWICGETAVFGFVFLLNLCFKLAQLIALSDPCTGAGGLPFVRICREPWIYLVTASDLGIPLLILIVLVVRRSPLLTRDALIIA